MKLIDVLRKIFQTFFKCIAIFKSLVELEQARSPDLTVCDFWLWSFLRKEVYKPEGAIFESLDQLANRIENELQAIPTAMFRQAFRDFPKRRQLCVDNDDGLFEM